MKKIFSFFPGVLLALGIAAIARVLEYFETKAGLHIIGASVIALFIGMLVNAFYKPNKVTAPGIKFTSKKLLKFAIILLGASLNIATVLTIIFATKIAKQSFFLIPIIRETIILINATIETTIIICIIFDKPSSYE